MLDNLFSRKCMSLIGPNGRALSGSALENAEHILNQAKLNNHIIWSDRNGFLFKKNRKLFASAIPITDNEGNPLRICGRMVKTKAKFCSKCGSSAPGSWWRCGGCGRMIGYESQTCPHCGKVQNTMLRLDISDGNWQKNEDVFAERFQTADIAPLMPKGLNIQESQHAILLEGGAVTDVLSAGFYKKEDLCNDDAPERSIVMVDASEFVLPVCVEDIRTQDDLVSDLHAVITLRFNPENAANFMCNLMGNSLYLHNDEIKSAIGYDEIAHNILQNIDVAVREFCSSTTIEELFKSADIRLRLEDHIAIHLKRNLDAVGMDFIRLQEMEFESETFEKLRNMSGQIEEKRREIEFRKRADELANDATRREAMSEYEMEDYMNQLAHEKGIKDEMRVQEVERMRKNWERQKEREALSHEHDLDDIQQNRQLERDRTDKEFEQEMLDLRNSKELARRLEQEKAALESMNIESKVQDIKIDIEKKKTQAEIEATKAFWEIQKDKKAFSQNQKLELLNAASQSNIQALLMIEDDPEKRRDLLALHEQQMQAKMTPELLLAAAAARGNAAAADALSRMNKEQLELIERSKKENKDVFEHMLQMNERMFNQATESMARKSEAAASNNTTQIIK